MAGFVLLAPTVPSNCGPCQIAGPLSQAAQPGWLASLKADRALSLARINFTGGVFDRPELVWTQSSYIQPQIHPYDRFFYDAASSKYTLDRFLDDLNYRYGGVDAILILKQWTQS